MILSSGSPPRRPSDRTAVARIVRSADFDGTLFSEDIGTATYYVQNSRRDSGAFRRYAGRRRVADDQFVVLGDNRDNSDDSRSYGAVPRSSIDGKAQIAW